MLTKLTVTSASRLASLLAVVPRLQAAYNGIGQGAVVPMVVPAVAAPGSSFTVPAVMVVPRPPQIPVIPTGGNGSAEFALLLALSRITADQWRGTGNRPISTPKSAPAYYSKSAYDTTAAADVLVFGAAAAQTDARLLQYLTSSQTAGANPLITAVFKAIRIEVSWNVSIGTTPADTIDFLGQLFAKLRLRLKVLGGSFAYFSPGPAIGTIAHFVSDAIAATQPAAAGTYAVSVVRDVARASVWFELAERPVIDLKDTTASNCTAIYLAYAISSGPTINVSCQIEGIFAPIDPATLTLQTCTDSITGVMTDVYGALVTDAASCGC